MQHAPKSPVFLIHGQSAEVVKELVKTLRAARAKIPCFGVLCIGVQGLWSNFCSQSWSNYTGRNNPKPETRNPELDLRGDLLRPAYEEVAGGRFLCARYPVVF